MRVSLPEPLDGGHRLEGFACGKPGLDAWLITRARSNQRHGFTSVLVMHEDMQVVGFYGLAPSSVTPAALPRSLRTGQPLDPVPCFLLAQLAVDRRQVGRGLGSILLSHALVRCVQASRLVGGRAVMVRAIDEDAAGFWRAHAFEPTRDDPLLLFRSVRDIATAIQVTSS